jgi:PAS domain S-box-containing protein
MAWDQRVNILMVDDQPAKLLTYEVILEELDANLIKATSASQALNILLKNDIAVVLMDVSMPDVGGFELADAIRQHPRFQKTAIIFISGVHLADSDKIQGYRSGAVDYIAVPVVPEVLRAKVGIFAELHRKTRMLERLNLDLERRVEERTQELQEREVAFRTRAELLDLASEAIIVRDLSGTIRFWSAGAEDLYGWSREEAVGQDLHALLHTIFPTSREEVAASLEKQRSWQGNLLQTTKNGYEIVVAYRKTVNQESNAILEVGRDITAQLRAEEALRETEKLAAMGRVAGIIAHEINNPLAAITNIFYLLQKHTSLDEEARHFAALADQELQRVSHITRQTLSFYRETKQPVAVPIEKLLDEVAELQETRLHSSNIVLQKKYSASLRVYGFPFELRQVFMNLIANAIQAMSTGGILRLCAQDTTDWATRKRGVTVSITDTGQGIQPEHKEHLFEPFFTTKSTKGTGLGLWISKGIVQKYNGHIAFRSYFHARGCVTSFRIFIPADGVMAGPPSTGGGGLRAEHEAASSNRSSLQESSKVETPTTLPA